MSLARRVSIGLVSASVVACNAAPASPPTTATLVGTGSGTPAGAERRDATRAQVLAALDAGETGKAHAALRSLLDSGPDAPGARALEAALRALRIDADADPAWTSATLFANVRPVRAGPLPPPATAGAVSTLVATRGLGSPGSQSEAEARLSGRTFTGGPGGAEGAPAYLPPRIGAVPVRSLRASDGRWLAIYGERYVAVVEASGRLRTLLDFAGWQTTARSERIDVVWAELAGDLLYVTANGSQGSMIVALDAERGGVRWRTPAEGLTHAFVVGTERILAWSYGSAVARRGELVSIDRATGRIVARRPTPEVGSGDAQLSAADGVVHAYASSSTPDPKHLQQNERLTVRMATATRPAPPEPTTVPLREPLQPYVMDARPDPRLAAWTLLDGGGDPRLAQRALDPVLTAHGTNVVALGLAHAIQATLGSARAQAAAQLAKRKPVLVPNDAPSGRKAPVLRPTARKLVVVSQRPSSFTKIFDEFPVPPEVEAEAPTWVPDELRGRRRNEDASPLVYATEGERATKQRVAVFSEPLQTALVAGWTGDRNDFLLEIAADVRFAEVAGTVLLAVCLRGGGAFELEARDTKTGALFWRLPGVHDQTFAAVDGYVVASTADGTSALLLVEADTGRIAATTKMAAPQDPFLVFVDPAKTIHAVSTVSALTLRLE